MQYKILLPDQYDMNVIRQRVSSNGSKTDGFEDLLFKAYLISEKDDAEKSKNEYSPLYLWKDSAGMNKFIFHGFYDNILNSFGWQHIKINIPLLCSLEKEFAQSKYVLEIEREFFPMQNMKPMNFSLCSNESTGKVLIYNPDKWKYSEYYFYQNMPKRSVHDKKGKIYQLLHLSM